MNNSNGAAMSKRKHKSDTSVALMRIKFLDNSNPKAFKVANLKRGLTKIELYLSSVKGKWSWAVLQNYKTKEIYHYYHPKEGIKRLTKKEYAQQLDFYNLYIIPTTSWKKKQGSLKGISEKVNSLDEIGNFYHSGVLRINIYQKGKLIGQYERGKLKMK